MSCHLSGSSTDDEISRPIVSENSHFIINEDTSFPFSDTEEDFSALVSFPSIAIANIQFQERQNKKFVENLQVIKETLSKDQISEFLGFAEKSEDPVEVVDFLWSMLNNLKGK